MLEISKKLLKMAGKYSGYEIFSDWIKADALSISNVSDQYRRIFSPKAEEICQRREAEYMAIVQKHGRETMQGFVELSGMLALELERNISDVLGAVYMEANLGSKITGQFFTPFHVAYASAELTIPKDVSPENPFLLNEPSCGGGAMIIAAAKVLQSRGVNYQRCMKVVAQDLDWKGVYMTYVQLSLLGIRAVVVQGDTLAEPYHTGYPPERTLYTPAQMGML